MKNDVIKIEGARENNLKNINLKLPKNKFIIMTGLSGSGKTTLAFDTIYAEGQRRYVESLSSYARQFLGGISKPEVDNIEGLSPAIAIDQKTTSNNPRSTLGTITEISDYLRLLYARCGDVYCPNHNQIIKGMTIDQMVNHIMKLEEGTRLEVLVRVLNNQKGSFKDLINNLIKEGFIRAYLNNEMVLLEEIETLNKNKKHTLDVIIDRLKIKEEIRSNLYDSLELASKKGDGVLYIKHNNKIETLSTNHACPKCGFSIGKLEPSFFSFNSPLGACSCCHGLGFKKRVDIDLLVPNKELSINQGAIKYYKNTMHTKNLEWQKFKLLCDYYNIDLDKPFKELDDSELNYILKGSTGPINYVLESESGRKIENYDYIEGVASLIERRGLESKSDFFLEYYDSFLREDTCACCEGNRLRLEALSVKIGGLNIAQLSNYSIKQTQIFFQNLVLDDNKKVIAKLLLEELSKRLGFLCDVGLEYLTLSRSASTLSGGEAQRIRLASQIGSALTGVLYVLDEPSIGLHQRDNDRLINSLLKIRDLGNTLIVVEHDEDTMNAADYIVDVGPKAGKNGGEIVYSGDISGIKKHPTSITGLYLSKRKVIDYPKERRKGNGKYLEIINAHENNLKNINVRIPLNTLIIVTGVSGSGKSSLINDCLSQHILKYLNRSYDKLGKCDQILGLDNLDKLVIISQDPIGRSPRSNPATYTSVFDDIRALFALSKDAKTKGYSASRFSFNVKGGRCEACQGDGVKRISMQFVPDVYVKCSVCGGQRYNEETLKVYYRDKNIYDILKMSVDESLIFFQNHSKIYHKLKVLQDVGLGYLELGQSALTLSGGEAQRVKLASELQKKASGKTLYILDEPTSGLHSEDVAKLIQVLRRIVENGDSVIVIEHNLDMIKNADFIIDLGPEGGEEGGELIDACTVEQLIKNKRSYTGQYLKKVL